MASAPDETHQTSRMTDGTSEAACSAALPADATEQLAEIGAQLDRVRRESDLRLVELIDMVEAADWRGVELVAELQGQFLTGNMEKLSAEQVRIWDAVVAYLDCLAAGYVFLVRQFQIYSRGWAEVGDRLPLVIAHALRATAQRMKWMRMRYRPIEPDAWKTLSQLWSYVEDKGLARARVLVYDDRSTVQREFTKPLMFAVSAIDSLPPVEIDVAYRLITHVAGRFEVQRYPAKGCYFFVDIDQWTEPARHRLGGAVRLGSRFFGPGDAVADLETISERVAAGAISTSEVNLEGIADDELVIDVLAHLERHWAPTRPERREKRRRSQTRMSVLVGYTEIVEHIARGNGGKPVDNDKVELWAVANESETGYGAIVPAQRGETLNIGQLVGVQPAGSRMWAVGIVRRLVMQDATHRYVGIELLGRGVQLVDLCERGSGETVGSGLLLPSHIGDSVEQGEINLLLPPGGFSPRRALEMLVYEISYSLMPQMALEIGDDFEVGRYRIDDRTE